MDRSQAYGIAQAALLKAEDLGFNVASGKVGSVSANQVKGNDGVIYDVELIYASNDPGNTRIRITCRVTPINWYRHEQLEESITLCAPAN